VIIAIVVLEMRTPGNAGLKNLSELAAACLSYVLSFLFLAIYWDSDHRRLHTVEHVHGVILWASTHLLFGLPLVPFSTAWTAEHPSST